MVNQVFDMFDEAGAPAGGFKQSGLGREFGTYGLTSYLEPQAIFSEHGRSVDGEGVCSVLSWRYGNYRVWKSIITGRRSTRSPSQRNLDKRSAAGFEAGDVLHRLLRFPVCHACCIVNSIVGLMV
jgi:hypothetical protein